MFHPRGPGLGELLHQGMQSVERGYDLLAPKFDYTPFRTPEDVLAASLALAGPPRSLERALDVCCGTGAAMRHLRPLCREAVVGVDLSQGMLDEGRRRLMHESDGAPGGAQVEWVRGDALALPWHEAFDLVTSFGAFGHILERDEPRFVEGIHRVLRPGGRFLFVTGDVPSRWRPGYWVARGFNAAMRVRNALWRPPFVMYYLTFLLPRARMLLEAHGFQVAVHRDALPEKYAPHGLCVVVATRR